MKRAFIFQSGRSNKFWRISCNGPVYTVHFGRINTNGRMLDKRFRSEEECFRQAERIIAQKLKKGYWADPSFDRCGYYYDDPNEGLNAYTSHPRFTGHFTQPFYYMADDGDAPFGMKESLEALRALEMLIREQAAGNVENVELTASFPHLLIERDWDMLYVPAHRSDEAFVKKLLEGPKLDRMSNAELLLLNDRVIVAAALGGIKIMGELSLALRTEALRSLDRMAVLKRLTGDTEEGRWIREQIAKDLASFDTDVH
ncbi:WGR domain-containing protein [Paenibacillus gorillae]|uniref:WGR domain-containing protein n=1 Tax=Paenibacillus gorillae TaxID=1243662 RepID=UPI0004B9826A|nr:WGR domain-containing protein [Paenibacillus gorillae]